MWWWWGGGRGSHLCDNFHEGDPERVEDLDPLFIIPGVQDNSFPPVAARGVGPELLLDGLEVVCPWHPGWPHPYQPLGSHQSTSGHLADAGCGRWSHLELQPVDSGTGVVSHGDQLPHHVQMAMYNVLQLSSSSTG